MGWFLTRDGFRAGSDAACATCCASRSCAGSIASTSLVPVAARRGRCSLLGERARSAGAPGLGTDGWQMLVWGFFISTVAALPRHLHDQLAVAHASAGGATRPATTAATTALLALLTLGEGWHNNHHHYPGSARQGFYWWEIDITYYGLEAARRGSASIWDLQPVPGAKCADARPEPRAVRVAIVGAGISGLVAPRRPAPRRHEVTVFEARDWIGGHTHTVDVEDDGRTIAIDTGFIVFNDWTYPNFIAHARPARRAVAALEHELQRCSANAPGSSTTARRSNSLFAQRRNLFRPSFLRMIRDILRFNREAPASWSRATSRPPSGSTSTRGDSAARSSSTTSCRWAAPSGRPRPGRCSASRCASSSTSSAEPWLPVDQRPARLAGGARRLARVRARADRAVRALDPDRRPGARRSARLPQRSHRCAPGRRSARFDARDPRLPQRPGAARCWRIRRRRSARSSARSPISRTKPCCTPTQSVLPRRPLARAAWNYHLRDRQGLRRRADLRHERAAVARHPASVPGRR